ncbi:MAG: DUF192 domain-containing protein [Alphaproteobacteria bacterium]|nr:DUF192 domain-containing protein [Alphaproteobacteria bacterium]
MKLLKIIFIMLVCLACCSNRRPKFDTGFINFNKNITIKAEIARTDEQKKYGLMFLKNIPEKYGMVFKYDKEKYISMWMKNTYIPLDIFFINKDGIISQIEKNNTPLSLKHIRSKEKSLYVIETKSGFANKFDIKVGDKAYILKN